MSYEILAFDNKEGIPIAKVYNRLASQAKGEFLLFAHEDIIFHTKGWGEIICKQLSTPRCGVIGFAGSKLRLPVVGPLCQSPRCFFCNFLTRNATKPSRHGCRKEHDFEEVVTLDGMAMFCTKEAWGESPFDEENIKGFHLYDIDFTLCMAVNNRQNYVCTSKKVRMEHLSSGNYSMAWLEQTIALQKNKWDKLTPLCTDDLKETFENEKASYYFDAYDALYGILCMNITLHDRDYVESIVGSEHIEQYDAFVKTHQYGIAKSVMKRRGTTASIPFVKQTRGWDRFRLSYKYLWYRYVKGKV